MAYNETTNFPPKEPKPMYPHYAIVLTEENIDEIVEKFAPDWNLRGTKRNMMGRMHRNNDSTVLIVALFEDERDIVNFNEVPKKFFDEHHRFTEKTWNGFTSFESK